MLTVCHAAKAFFRTVLFAALVCSTTVHATSVVEVSLQEMLQHSALVFEGRVIDLQVREHGSREIQTLLTFEITDVIKGEVNGRKITLGFLGGTLAGRQVSVSDMQMPALNERGIYFVESPGRNQVHPFYGWSQGHLRLVPDATGTERVVTRSGRPVRGIERISVKRPRGLSKGVARGLILGASTDRSTALDSREFKWLLRAMQ
jgi:hypothetical protein